MAFSSQSLSVDYDQQPRWIDCTSQHANFFPHYSTPSAQFESALNKPWHKSTGSNPIFPSEHYDTDGSTQRSTYEVNNIGLQHDRYQYGLSPEISGYQGDLVASPIDETTRHFNGYTTINNHPYHRQHQRRSSLSHQWAHEIASQGRNSVPDEYRASIARQSDEIHEWGLHGLEGDNDHPRRFGISRKVKTLEWNTEVADGIHKSLAPLAFSDASSSTTYANTNKSPELSVVPFQQQPATDYSFDQKSQLGRSQSPDELLSSNKGFQSAQTPLMNSLPPPPMSPASSPRQGLEHHHRKSSSGSGSVSGSGCASASASPGHQEDLQSDAFPGSSQSILKLTTPKKVTEKKQALACLFCRERKIACGRPDPDSEDQTCNQCARRHLDCEYPKESRRGQHKRTRRKATHDHDVNQSSPQSTS